MTFSGYRTLRLLRRGESAAVYDAWSEERGCRCVVKVLRGRSPDARAARALEAEGRLLLRLSHPHLVRAYALVRRPRLALVLETLTGETLSHLLHRRRAHRLGAADVARLGLQLASALAYLHRAGVLHLDLKPSNVVCQGGIAKLLDLGIARPPGPGRAGVGTDDYLAPEQARGGELTQKTDVFGLGCLLYEAAAGCGPFRSSPGRWAQLRGPAPPVASRRKLPTHLARSIDACLDPDPGRRPGLDDVARALARAVAEQPARPRRRSNGSTSSAARLGRHPRP